MEYRLKWKNVVLLLAGCAIFSLGFAMFLEPNQIHAGGVSGLSLLIVSILNRGAVGAVSILINVPLFILGYRRIGRKFFWGSLIGMAVSSILLDLFALIPAPQTEPLMASLFGGSMCGFGCGLVFHVGASTGGSDILGRVLKQRMPNFPLGKVIMCIDLTIVALTAVVFHDINKSLYSAVTLYVSSLVLDSVIYSFDYSKVALIISDKYEQIAKAIDEKLDRGITLLQAQGYYIRQDKYVLLCAIKKDQLAELKELVANEDPKAFVILQEAHQVLGDGFKRYSKDSIT